MKIYRYKTIINAGLMLDLDLDALGRDQWRCVNVFPLYRKIPGALGSEKGITTDQGSTYVYVFERQIEQGVSSLKDEVEIHDAAMNWRIEAERARVVSEILEMIRGIHDGYEPSAPLKAFKEDITINIRMKYAPREKHSFQGTMPLLSRGPCQVCGLNLHHEIHIGVKRA